MKRGEKILLAIGTAWTVGILLLLAERVVGFGLEFLYPERVVQITATIFGIWTVLGLIWVFVYGRRE